MEDLSEKEQIEVIRSWWQENGRYVISGIVIGVGLLFGWNYWKDRQHGTDLGASALYESLLSEVGDTDVAAAEALATRLYGEFGSTIYALHGRLAMARLYMDVGRDQDAAEVLRQVIAARREPETALVARLRLAKILLYQDKTEEVVSLLEGHADTAFAARYHEAIGDAYAARGRIEEAAAAYTAALADDPNTPTVDRTLIQMKLYDLPKVPAGEAMKADTIEGEGVTGDDAVPATLPGEPAAGPDEEPGDDPSAGPGQLPQAEEPPRGDATEGDSE